ncbi:hypothetical protein ABR737_01585 [Streptomyces sp. Edi2]|uniref:hypothetical protein n=1 Tax=Streptomyces sp. Edi2 TaxID=3162528 RepID=UPI0033056960
MTATQQPHLANARTRVFLGRAVRALAAPLAARVSRHRRDAELTARFDQQLRTAADAAISLARRALYDVTWRRLMPQERLTARGEVTVEDVTDAMQLLYGIVAIPPEKTAAALRAAYEAREGHVDLTTDAYDR